MYPICCFILKLTFKRQTFRIAIQYTDIYIWFSTKFISIGLTQKNGFKFIKKPQERMKNK